MSYNYRTGSYIQKYCLTYHNNITNSNVPIILTTRAVVISNLFSKSKKFTLYLQHNIIIYLVHNIIMKFLFLMSTEILDKNVKSNLHDELLK